MKFLSVKQILVLGITFAASLLAWADNNAPYIYVLGVTQDAGYPQTGCYQPHCLPGWENPELKRGAVSLGLIDPESRKKYMFEATPNFPDQLYMLVYPH